VQRLLRETDPKILRQAVSLLENENRRLGEKIAGLMAQLAAAKGEDAATLQLRLTQLEQQLARKNKMIFGNSSEKRAAPEATAEPESKPDSPPQTGHGRREQTELPIVDEIHNVDEADKACTQCGKALKDWEGQFEESFEIDVTPRRFVLKRHLRKKARCECGGCIETAPGPLKLCDGARYSVDFAIEVAASKFLDHMPLERQVRTMGREGLIVDSQTLWDQTLRLGTLLSPVCARILGYIHSHSVVGADETRWRIMGKDSGSEDGTKWWQLWLVQCPTAVFYTIKDSRSKDAAKAILDGYHGVVMCDAYGAYPALQKDGNDFTLANCWSHARREIVEVEEVSPTDAAEALVILGKLFHVETLCRAGPEGDDERRKLRNEQSRPLVDEFQAWMLRAWANSIPESGMRKALKYIAGIWTGLTRFLDDPRIPLHNNSSERAARGPVVGRKNFYGSRSRRGTEIAAIFYTLLESAKLAGVDPKAYLRAATLAALRGEVIPLPHEFAKTVAAAAAAA